MKEYRFFQADVFTDRPFTGNPLAIFPEAEGLTTEEMQSIAKEMNLSETTFVLPPTDLKARLRLRIFTPDFELPLAGHPVVGTCFVLAARGVKPGRSELRVCAESLWLSASAIDANVRPIRGLTQHTFRHQQQHRSRPAHSRTARRAQAVATF